MWMSDATERCLTTMASVVLYHCEVCAKKNLRPFQTKYCKDCKIRMCCQCESSHIASNKDHKVVGIYMRRDSIEPDQCQRHKDRNVEWYCPAHDEYICSMCAYSNHKDCHATILNEEVFTESRTKLEETSTTLDNLSKQADHYLQAWSIRKDNHFHKIDECTKNLHSKIDELNKKARKEIQTKYDQLASEAKTRKAKCDEIKEEINKQLNDKVTQNKVSMFKLSGSSDNLTHQAEKLTKEMTTLRNQKLNFKMNTQIEGSLKQFSSLVTTAEDNTASPKGIISLRSPGQSKLCNIVGSCVLIDGTILLADCNDASLKRVDATKSTTVDHIIIEDELKGITCIGRNEVAVATGQAEIKIISLESQMRLARSIKLPNTCSGIAKGQQELFATQWNRVHVYDLDGNLRRTISTNDSGQNMFSLIKGVAASQKENRVYIIDANGLICINKEGKELFKCSNAQMKMSSAAALCSDGQGCILVSGVNNFSNKIVRVANNGSVLEDILSKIDQFDKPQCMCFDGKKKILYIGGNTNQILTYELA